MPTGKVKWFDNDKGFGFVSQDSGPDVYVHKDALPAGVETLKPGARVEFGIAQGRRGDQALSVRILDPIPSVAKALRKDPEEIALLLEDMIKLLDGLSNSYRRGRRPAAAEGKKIAALMRAIADDVEG